MAGTKRQTKDMELITKNYLLEKIYRIKGNNILRDQALIAFLYLTGARISEIVKPNQCVKQEFYPLKAKDIEIEDLNNRKYYLVNNVRILKRKSEKAPKRIIPIPMDADKAFVDIFTRYFMEVPFNAYLWDITPQRAWQIVEGATNLYPHYMRHLRLSHLTKKGMSGSDLKQITGWADEKPATHYVHLNWRDIAKKM
tara:strand:+ start:5026 stop:5616 length:591 start_codon:yes stop_codon:yes gene_type:complete